MKVSLYAVLAATTACSAVAPAGRGVTSEVPAGGDQRFFRGYIGPNQTGLSYEFTEYSPDLSAEDIDNAITSTFVNGLWFMFNHTHYNGSMCAIAGIDRSYTWDTTHCTQMASSLRYAGSPYGLNDNFYNLYDHEDMTGEEFRGNTNVYSFGGFDSRTSSLIITGQSEWTLYTGEGYTGSSVCVSPMYKEFGEDGVVFDYAMVSEMSQIGVPDNSIRSIARGCFGDRVVGTSQINTSTSRGLWNST